MKAAATVFAGVLVVAAACIWWPSTRGVEPTSTPFAANAASLPALERPLAGWTETASREFYDSALNLKWRHLLGDWRDADDQPQGDKPFVTAAIGPRATSITLDVTRYVQRYGAEFLLRRDGAPVEFVSREGAAGPLLEIVQRGESRRLSAIADVSPEPSTYKSLGTAMTLRSYGPVLIRFAQEPHPAISRAVLTLTLAAPASGPATLKLFRPDVGGDVAMPRFRPATSADVIARWTGADLARNKDWPTNRPHARVDGTILTAWIPRNDLTALSLIQPINGGQEAFATVVMRFAPDWQPGDGGKLPGFANTGQGKPAVDGLGPGGWGGRPANGVRWSARTGFDRFDPASRDGARWTGLHSYFYALAPPGIWGTIEPWSRPVPKGRWFAYTQWVKLNAPGRDDGALGYWLDGAPVHRRDGIRWRDRAGRETEINEFWLDVYCGGASCGPLPHPHEHRLQIASVLLTRTTPDFAAVQADVDRLNAAR